MHTLMQNSGGACSICVECLSVYRTLFTDYLICSLNNPIFVDIGALDELMGKERGNDFFGGPRLQKGIAGADPGPWMLSFGAISLKLSSLSASSSILHCDIPSCFRAYSEVSLRDLEERGSQLPRESFVEGCFLRLCLHGLALYPMSSVEDLWVTFLLSRIKRDFSLL